MSGLSSSVTFLSTDIEGSTELLQRLGDSHYADVLGEHWQLLRAAIREGNGREVGSHGDGVLVEFRNAANAVRAAVAAQLAITLHPWPDRVVIRVRMGLHTGERVHSAGGPISLNVNRAARIREAGHGGQILVSSTTWGLIENNLPEEVSARDLGSHRLKDLKQPERIFQLLHPQLPADFPPLRSLSARSNNLPIQLTSFIGHEQEVAEIARLLPTTRLLTLTGAGGCGKTRLGLQVAATLLERFEDGVWFVDLSALSDPGLVSQAVASVLSVPEQPDRTLTEALVSFLRSKSLLVVLDNCEHLVDSCAHLTEALLRSCLGLRVLATSREPLNIGGEVTFRVPSLSLPEPEATVSAEHMVRYEAVRLFVDRGRIAHSEFELTGRNALAVARICRRLDGIPLAIELAAARVTVLSVEQIAERLDDLFRLLTGGSRTALPRHRTLRATMDWSYALMSEKERMFLRRLSVFAGGWTLDAAEVVCAQEGIEKQEVLDLLGHLVDKSLVLVVERDAAPRYRQLETVRQYALEKLVESGDALSVRTRHLDWYWRLAEEAEQWLSGVGQAVWFDRLETEHDNLRVALEWSLESGAIEAGLRLAGGVWQFWSLRGYLAEGRRWLDSLLERSTGVAPIARAKALRAAGRLAGFGQGDYAYGRLAYEESLAIWREAEDRHWVATLIGDLGVLAFVQGDFASARALYEESLAIWRELEDRWGIALSLHNLGRAAYRQGKWEEAHSLFMESLVISRELGDTQGIAVALTNLGYVALSRGDCASAQALFEKGLTMQQELGDKRRIAYSLEGFAFIAVAQGQPHRAARLIGAAEALRESIGAPLPPVDREDYEQMVASARSGLGNEVFAAAREEGGRMTLELAVREAKGIA